MERKNQKEKVSRQQPNIDCWEYISDKYKTISTIGEGSFGVVMKAERISDGKIVAIKCIRNILGSHSEAKNAYRELQIMRKFTYGKNYSKLLYILFKMS